MQYYRLEHNACLLQGLVSACTGAGERARGLLGRRRLEQGSAWLFSPCRQIHTFGMRYAIDVLFCDAGWRVLDLLEELGPWRIAGHRQACATWELPAGSIRRLGLRLGDRLRPC